RGSGAAGQGDLRALAAELEPGEAGAARLRAALRGLRRAPGEGDFLDRAERRSGQAELSQDALWTAQEPGAARENPLLDLPDRRQREQPMAARRSGRCQREPRAP